MTNRINFIVVCLLLILVSGDREEEERNTSHNVHKTHKNSHWIGSVQAEKHYMPAHKEPGQFGISRGNIQTKKSHQASSDLAGSGSNTKEKMNIVGLDLNPDLHKLTSLQLWQYWKDLLNKAEFQQIPIIGALLSERLHKQPDPEIYEGITNLLMQPNVSVEAKALLLDLLREIATPNSLAQLIDLAEQAAESPLYMLILQAISHIGDNRWDGKFHEELSPVLEAAWSNPGLSDPTFLNAVGTAIAEVGAPNGVDQLLLTVSGNNTGAGSEETDRIKQEVAFQVIPSVRNPNAIQILSNSLNQEPLGTAAFEASGNALAGIGSPEATQEIVDAATQMPAEGAIYLQQWLPKINDAESLKLIVSAPNKAFHNPAIKAEIDASAASAASSSALSIPVH